MIQGLDSSATAVWTVQALCQALNTALQERFNPIQVEGEIAGWSQATSGHCYFSLKDPSGVALLRCAMFRRAATSVRFTPANGQRVRVQGRLGVYENRGDLQLVVETMQAAGAGALLERFLQLKAKLEQAGYFAPERKRPIPSNPRSIGIVTSLGAAALHDVAHTLQRRVPHIPVLLAPASVQGPDSLDHLLTALNALQDQATVDVILLVRGGGSTEDLWTFNEESLVHAIADSRVPIISGVGHETDFSLSDFAADLRAPTPTAAAELAATPLQHWQQMAQTLEHDLKQGLTRALEKKSMALDYASASLQRPADWLGIRKTELSAQWLRLRQGVQWSLQKQHATLQAQTLQLQALNPWRVLDRGFAVLRQKDGKSLQSVATMQAGDCLEALLSDGRLDLLVQTVTSDKPNTHTSSPQQKGKIKP